MGAYITFTAVRNNFELAIAVAIAVCNFPVPQAVVGIINTLWELPVLILLVRASLRPKKK